VKDNSKSNRDKNQLKQKIWQRKKRDKRMLNSRMLLSINLNNRIQYPCRKSKILTKNLNNKTIRIQFWENRLNNNSKDSISWLLPNLFQRFLIGKFSWTIFKTNVACIALLNGTWIRSSPQTFCLERNSCWDNLKLREFRMHPTLKNSQCWIFGRT